MLYEGVTDTIRNKAENAVKGNILYIIIIVLAIIAIFILDILSSSMDCLLESLLSVWKEHKITIVSVKDILMYMDR
jgi:hypothetical protein